MTDPVQTDTSSPIRHSSRTTTWWPVSNRAPIDEPRYSTVPLRSRASGPSTSRSGTGRDGTYPSRTSGSACSPGPASWSGDIGAPLRHGDGLEPVADPGHLLGRQVRVHRQREDLG